MWVEPKNPFLPWGVKDFGLYTKWEKNLHGTGTASLKRVVPPMARPGGLLPTSICSDIVVPYEVVEFAFSGWGRTTLAEFGVDFVPTWQR